MTNQELYDLMARFDAGGLLKLKLSQGDFQIELGKAAPAAAAAVPASAAPAAVPEKKEEAPAVTAPLVGTFYAAPAPEQPPFVTPGDQVKKFHVGPDRIGHVITKGETLLQAQSALEAAYSNIEIQIDSE